MAPDLITGQKVKHSITDTQILHVSLFYKRTLCTGGELFIFQTHQILNHLKDEKFFLYL